MFIRGTENIIEVQNENSKMKKKKKAVEGYSQTLKTNENRFPELKSHFTRSLLKLSDGLLTIIMFFTRFFNCFFHLNLIFNVNMTGKFNMAQLQ